jgi:virulence factor Mce-like protein
MQVIRAGKPIGAVAAVALCAGVGLLASGCAVVDSVNHGLGRTIEVTADFENIAGMYQGNSVDVLGMAVGRIDGVQPHGTYVTVTMSIDSGTPIPADAIAALVSPSVVTDRHIELTPAYRGSGPTLKDGDHLGTDRTRTPVEIDQLIKTVDEFAGALKADGPDGTPGPLSGRVAYPMLNGNGDRIRQTLEGLSGALKVGVNDRNAIANLIVKLNDLTTLLADNDTQVEQFSNRITNLSAMLAQQAPGLRAVLAQVDDFLANTSAVLAQNSGSLTGALSGLDVTAEQLRRNARNLTEVVDLAPLLFQNLNNAMTSMSGGAIRLHLLLDKSFADNELLSLFCTRILKRPDGCRVSEESDLGPDFGIGSAIVGFQNRQGPK